MIREVTGLCEFPHAEALGAVVRARDVVAEAAMAVALAALSGDALSEVEGQDLLARARVAVRDADLAVSRAQETAALYGAGREGGCAAPHGGGEGATREGLRNDHDRVRASFAVRPDQAALRGCGRGSERKR